MEKYLSVYIENLIMLIVYPFFSLCLVALLGWIIYEKLFYREISLKKQLFENDSLTVWLEFVGGFLAPALYLVSIIITPTGLFIYKGQWTDFITIGGYIFQYLIIFSVFRYIVEGLIGLIGKLFHNKKVSLKNEIYMNNNIPAAFFSVSISIMAVNILLLENKFYTNLPLSLMRIGLVLLITSSLISVYTTFFLPKGISLFNKLFIEKNKSTGILILGYTTAINLIIYAVINWIKKFNPLEIILFITFIYLIMVVIVNILKWILNKLLNININQELFEQDNMGYALMESSVYILLSLIVINGILV